MFDDSHRWGSPSSVSFGVMSWNLSNISRIGSGITGIVEGVGSSGTKASISWASLTS